MLFHRKKIAINLFKRRDYDKFRPIFAVSGRHKIHSGTEVDKSHLAGPGGVVEVLQDVSGHTELCYLDASPFLHSAVLHASCLAMSKRVRKYEEKSLIHFPITCLCHHGN